MNLAELKTPFDPAAISWRVGSTTKDKAKGMALAYIDARDVQDRLDAVCGVDGWQCRYVPMHDKKTVCEIGIRTVKSWVEQTTDGKFIRNPDEWIWKADGAGDSDVEAEKGALSDAFKRAAVRWGIGRYLYDLDSPWVELDTYEKNGQVFAKGIKSGEYAKLRAILAGKGAATSAVITEAPKAAMEPAAYAAQCETRISNIKTPEDAKKFRAANYAGLSKLDSSHPELFERVMKALITKETSLKMETA